MNILIVEDELQMLELLRQGLSERGFTVMTAADGEAGLQMASEHCFDSIVLDLGLPRLDGFSLIFGIEIHGFILLLNVDGPYCGVVRNAWSTGRAVPGTHHVFHGALG